MLFKDGYYNVVRPTLALLRVVYDYCHRRPKSRLATQYVPCWSLPLAIFRGAQLVLGSGDAGDTGDAGTNRPPHGNGLEKPTRRRTRKTSLECAVTVVRSVEFCEPIRSLRPYPQERVRLHQSARRRIPDQVLLLDRVSSCH